MEEKEPEIDRLFVYECRGAQPPRSEPVGEGLLGLWPEPPFYYIFCLRKSNPSVIKWIEDQPGWFLRDCYELDYDQWQQVPTGDHQVGPFLVRILMPRSGAERGARDGNSFVIDLDPGVVFGSGLHATTKGCLLTLASLYGSSPFDSAVDLGTGTGILAIACALLGASKVWALDSNSLAVRVAGRNIVSNGLEGVVRLLIADGLEAIKAPGDLLVMNIEWPSLKKVIEGGSWTRFRKVVLSGLLAAHSAEVERLLPSKSKVLSRLVLDDWLTLTISP
jgi:ribosomal protein L11 methyltransferase